MLHKKILHLIDVWKIYQSDDYDKMYEALSKFWKKNKISNTLIENYEYLNENLDFEQKPLFKNS